MTGGAADELARILDDIDEADDALRRVVEILAEQDGIQWAGVAFVEDGELALGPAAGSPDEARRARVPVLYHGDRVGELRGILDRVDRHKDFRRHALVELSVGFELRNDRARQRVKLRLLALDFGRRRRFGLEEVVGLGEPLDLRALFALDERTRAKSDLETVFLMTRGQHVVTSSTLIKQIVEIGRYDHDHLSRLVPLDVARKLEQRLRRNDQNNEK